jgi:endonuclease-8
VESVQARGKALLTTFDNAWVVYTHNQLYGRWMIRRAGSDVATRRQLRLAIETDDHRALLFSASTIELLKEGEIDHHPFLSRLGPDPLQAGTTVDTVRRHLEQPTFARRQLGGLLLEQRFVGGIGNYLRSEILYHARLGHQRRLVDLNSAERARLARSIVTITVRSYETGGLTRAPAQAASLKRQGVRRREYRHYVFGRAGRPCPRCGATVDRVDVGGRRLYRCADCQA